MIFYNTLNYYLSLVYLTNKLEDDSPHTHIKITGLFSIKNRKSLQDPHFEPALLTKFIKTFDNSNSK